MVCPVVPRNLFWLKTPRSYIGREIFLQVFKTQDIPTKDRRISQQAIERKADVYQLITPYADLISSIEEEGFYFQDQGTTIPS